MPRETRTCSLSPQRAAVGLMVFVLLWCSGGAARAQTTTSLSGTVRDDSHAVLPGVIVTATNASTGVTWSATSGADGRYTIAGLTPGTYSVAATLSGFAVGRVERVSVGVGQAALLDILLPVGDSALGTISGTVKGAGRALLNARVEARLAGETRAKDTTDAEGKYELEALPPGTYRVTASADGFEPSVKNVSVRQRQAVTRNFALKRPKR